MTSIPERNAVLRTLAEIEAAALALSREDLVKLVERLIAHTDGEPPATPLQLEALWIEEIERRVAAADGGQTTSMPHEEVMSELRARIEAHGDR